MTYVVINRCYGGFGLSQIALDRLNELGVKVDNPRSDIERDNPLLVQVVRDLGVKANGPFAELKIVDIPDDVAWHVDGYDGIEHIAEDHRTWS